MWLHRLRLWLLVKIEPHDLKALIMLPFEEGCQNLIVYDGLTDEGLFSIDTEYVVLPSILVRSEPGKVRPRANVILKPFTNAGPMVH